MDNCKRSISKRNELLAHGSTWMNLAIIMRREKSQTQKITGCIRIYLYEALGQAKILYCYGSYKVVASRVGMGMMRKGHGGTFWCNENTLNLAATLGYMSVLLSKFIELHTLDLQLH